MGMRISEKRIAASTLRILTGCRVTSTQSSGVLHKSRKEIEPRIFWYSGR
jgi:hypothetical protein